LWRKGTVWDVAGRWIPGAGGGAGLILRIFRALFFGGRSQLPPPQPAERPPKEKLAPESLLGNWSFVVQLWTPSARGPREGETFSAEGSLGRQARPPGRGSHQVRPLPAKKKAGWGTGLAGVAGPPGKKKEKWEPKGRRKKGETGRAARSYHLWRIFCGVSEIDFGWGLGLPSIKPPRCSRKPGISGRTGRKRAELLVF